MTPELRSKVEHSVQEVARDLEFNVASLDEVLALVRAVSIKRVAPSYLTLFLFWASLRVDGCIAPLSKLLAPVHASQASVERLFST